MACEVGTALAARTDRVSLLTIGPLSNRLLLVGLAFELAVTAVAIYLPAAQKALGTRSLRGQELAVLAIFPLVVWEPTRSIAGSAGVAPEDDDEGVAGPLVPAMLRPRTLPSVACSGRRCFA